MTADGAFSRLEEVDPDGVEANYVLGVLASQAPEALNRALDTLVEDRRKQAEAGDS